MENTLEKLKGAKFGSNDWEKLEQLIKDKRRLCELYGIGTKIMTPDGEGNILSIHGRAVEVSLKTIKSTQVLHGYSRRTSPLHRTYLFKEFNCPLLLSPLSQITDEHAREVVKMICPTLCEVSDITRNGLRDWQFIRFGHDNNHIILGNVGAIRFTNYSKTSKSFIAYRSDVTDYLRSKGYYIGHGSETKSGLIKLKQD